MACWGNGHLLAAERELKLMSSSDFSRREERGEGNTNKD